MIAPWFILAVIATIAAVDFYLHVIYARNHKPLDWTISRLMLNLGYWWPMSVGLLAFAMGCLFGHLYLGISP